MNTTSSSILDGFGFGPRTPAPDLPVPSPVKTDDGHEPHTHRPLTRDSVAAQTLYQIISGERVILVDSPPGGGKTETLVSIVSHLANRFAADLPNITVATPRREQALNLFHRLTDVMHHNQLELTVSRMPAPEAPKDAPSARDLASQGRGTVRINTVAGMKGLYAQKHKVQGGRSLLLIDETYQVDFADAAAAASKFDQIVMVGDPGQIGPVVTINTGAWERLRLAPHRRAPEAFARMDCTVQLSMSTSYRLGPQTVATIAPLYPFKFASGRPDRTLIDRAGAEVPELSSVEVPGAKSSDDPRLLGAVARRVASLVGMTAMDTDAEGQTTSGAVEQQDVAVVVALNSQVSKLTGMLSAAGLDHVTVGTADSLQGGQWRAVVSLDPMAGGSASEHHLSLGRLCVMLSRHTTHLTWVHDDRWAEALDGAETQNQAIRTSRKVRQRLTRHAL